MPAPLEADWPKIREAVIAGVPISKVASAHGLGHWTIRKRAERESWPTPATIQKLAEQYANQGPEPKGAEQEEQSNGQSRAEPQGPEQSARTGPTSKQSSANKGSSGVLSSTVSKGVQGGVEVAELAAQSLVERAEAVGLRAVAIVESSLRPVSSLPVASMSDLKAALGIARTAAGLDKAEAPGVSINMALFGTGATSGATIDATGWTDDAQEADLERLEDD